MTNLATAWAGTVQNGAIAALADALALHQQYDLAGVLEAAALMSRRLESPAHIGAIVRDPATDQWRLAGITDPAGRPHALAQLGLPPGPYRLTPRPGSPLPLPDLFGDIWGVERCTRLERELGTVAAFAMPIPGQRAARGLLFALLERADKASHAGAVVAHAAVAAARLVEGGSLSSVGTLDMKALIERATAELRRTRFYQHELAVVTFEPEKSADVTAVYGAIAAELHEWDFAGCLEGEAAALALVLPNTNRVRASGFVRRVAERFPAALVGIAAFPEDGQSFDRLVEVARFGATRFTPAAHPIAASPVLRGTAPAHTNGNPGNGKGAPVHQMLDEGERGDIFSEMSRAALAHLWVRGTPSEGTDTVRCPRCLITYIRRRPAGAPATAITQARSTARATLQAECPSHSERMVVAE